MTAVWQASIKDDVSFVASRMATNLTALDKRASDLFADSAGNFKKFNRDLVASGTNATDAALIVGKYRKELIATRKEALGLGKAQVDVFAKAAEAAQRSADAQARAQAKIAAAQAKASVSSSSSTGSSMGGKLFTAANAMTVAHGAMGVVSGIADTAYEAGKSLTEAVWHAATFRQNALMGLSYMLKSADAADDFFTYIQKMAVSTPMKTEELLSMGKGLITAHATTDESKVMLKAIADVRSRTLEDPQKAIHLSEVFGKILGQGVATRGNLRELGAGGMSAEDITLALAKMPIMQQHMKGLKRGANKMETELYVRKLLSANKVGSRTLIQASLNAETERSGKGLGTLAEQKGQHTLTGVASTLGSAFWDLFESKSADLANSPGLKSLMEFMKRLVDMISPFSEDFEKSGSVVLKTVTSITDAMFQGLDNIGKEDIESFIQKIGKMGEGVVAIIKSAWSWMDRLIHEGSAGEFLDDIKDMLVDVGVEIGVGIVKGMTVGATEGAKAVLGIGQEDYIGKYGYGKDVLAGLAKEQGESLKKFLPEFQKAQEAFKAAGMGSWLLGGTQGQAQDITGYGKSQGIIGGGVQDIPKLAGGGIVTSPTLAIVGEAGPEAVVPLSTMGGYNANAISSLRGGAGSLGGGGMMGGISVSVEIGSIGGGDAASAKVAGGVIGDAIVEKVLVAFLERRAQEA